MAEERYFERVGSPIEVEYTVPGKGWLKGESIAKDISLGGIQLQVKEKIEPGSRIALRIRLPRRQRPTTATGELVWLRENRPSGKGFNVGIRFTQADPFDLEELLRELEETRE